MNHEKYDRMADAGSPNAPAAFITGGARGIGRTIAGTLLEAGWRVAVLDLISEPFADPQVLFYEGDVADESTVKQAMEETVRTFGRLDGLVNNAASAVNVPMEKISLAEWNRVLATNLTGPFLCTRYAAPHLGKQRGAIVNIASTRNRQSEPDTEAYSTSKGGITALTHATAISLGPAVRVNCISPGWIDTRPDALEQQSETDRLQHPCGRVGTPADIASLTAYLLSDRAGFITGQEFIVDGGMTRKMIYRH